MDLEEQKQQRVELRHLDKLREKCDIEVLEDAKAEQELVELVLELLQGFQEQ